MAIRADDRCRDHPSVMSAGVVTASATGCPHLGSVPACEPGVAPAPVDVIGASANLVENSSITATSSTNAGRVSRADR